ncbi:hypothetical protein D9Q98_010686 [Chlorella vulgaris]|uniref:Uncharacterized protein n=1 Tax=Chlorella vulgaris TaxID=3077 RepID=A0A9D4TEH1_CHLVU|nr:hypothetical protein D9Q98_010686 [Chlorella vulgaris]
MTSYDKEIDRLQGLVLDALRQHTLPEAVAQQLVHASFPDAVVSVSPPAFKPLPAAQQEQLTNALHAAAAQLLADAKAAGQQVMQYKLEPGREQAAVAELLDAVLWLAPQTPSPLDIGLPAQLLEQITEGASVQECEGVFVYLDSRTATFKSPAFAEMRCKNTLLRTCNMLLKRLSKSANAMLCGRILLFLAKLLPLTERSGVNLGGSFNTDNATPVEDVQETFFSNPQVALQPGKWGEVSRDIKRVLDKFRLEKVTVGESAAVASLRDATFRRHFLLQCLVLMQWCERPRQKDKAGLRAKLLEDMQELRARVYASLESTPDKGPQFAAAIRHLMQARPRLCCLGGQLGGLEAKARALQHRCSGRPEPPAGQSQLT